jgi:hypothetical protein
LSSSGFNLEGLLIQSLSLLSGLTSRTFSRPDFSLGIRAQGQGKSLLPPLHGT